jgi:hypothetical protein
MVYGAVTPSRGVAALSSASLRSSMGRAASGAVGWRRDDGQSLSSREEKDARTRKTRSRNCPTPPWLFVSVP